MCLLGNPCHVFFTHWHHPPGGDGGVDGGGEGGGGGTGHTREGDVTTATLLTALIAREAR
jgi:hypothetical protein